MTRQEYVKLIERAIEYCFDPNNAPFGLDMEEGRIFLRAKREALNWAIEMLPESWS